MKDSAEPIIHIHDLGKSYGNLLALDKLNLDVYQGEIFGYLGPNGAGKTTTIRLLLDFIRPGTGHASIFGLDIHRDAVAIHKRLGNLPSELTLYEQMTGWELLRYLGALRGGVSEDYIKELAGRFEMDLSRKTKDCSSGMKRKLGLIQSLMHQPEVLILDEPTIGLDPLIQQTFYQLIRELSHAGTTIFMSSHNLREVELVCDRVGILRKGKLVQVAHISELKQVRFRWLSLHFADEPLLSDFENLPGVSELALENHTLSMRVLGEIDPVIKAAAKYHVLDMNYEEPNLEDIFMRFYGEEA